MVWSHGHSMLLFPLPCVFMKQQKKKLSTLSHTASEEAYTGHRAVVIGLVNVLIGLTHLISRGFLRNYVLDYSCF